MPLAEREYMRRDPYGGPGPSGGGGGGLHFGLPRPTRGVVGVMIGCGVGAVLVMITGGRQSPLYGWLSLWPAKAYMIWQFLTFQFMHADFRHIVMNLIALYFFGPPLERLWGRRRFLTFYLVSGAFAGLCYMAIAGLLTLARPDSNEWWGSLVGASGGVLACLMACAILFPAMRVLFIPIRIAVAVLAVLYLLGVSRNLGDAAHLGGMAAAAGWIWLLPKLGPRLEFSRRDRGEGRWRRKLLRQRREQDGIDRILDKIRAGGIDSLSWWDKRKLREASRRRQGEDS